MCGAAYLDGALGAVPYLLIIMLPLFMNKVWNSIFVNLTAYKNLMIAKRRIQAVVDEPEEAGSFDALPATDRASSWPTSGSPTARASRCSRGCA